MLSDLSAKQSITSSVSDGILTITLNRPKKLNALRLKEFERLKELIRAFGADDDQRVLILTGSGRGFCSGEDLGELLEPGEADPDRIEARIEALQDVTRCLVALNKPTIAAVNGPAVGFGFEVTLATDIRICSTDAYFWMPEVQRGLLPANGVFYLLPRLIGIGNTARLMLTAEKVMPQEALELGIVSAVVGATDLQTTALDLAQGMLANSPKGTAMIKDLLRRSFDMTLAEVLNEEVRGTRELWALGEVLKGAQKFQRGNK